MRYFILVSLLAAISVLGNETDIIEYTAGNGGKLMQLNEDGNVVLSGVSSFSFDFETKKDNAYTIRAVPTRGYRFVGWSDDVLTSERTDGPFEQPFSVTANFQLLTYMVQFKVGKSGSLSGVTTQVVPYGGSATAVEVIPNLGHTFLRWSDGNTDNPRVVSNVQSDVTLIAFLKQDFKYRLLYFAGQGGVLIGDTEQEIMSEGDSGTTVEAVPIEGYHFVCWENTNPADNEIDPYRFDNPRTDFIVDDHVTVEAVFAPNPTVTIEIEKGWNLVSVPFQLESMAASDIFRDDEGSLIRGKLWRFSNRRYSSLRPNESLEVLRGYWLHSDRDAEISYSAKPLAADGEKIFWDQEAKARYSIPPRGWSIQGTSEKVNWQSEDFAIWRYSSRDHLIRSQEQLPGKAYWVYSPDGNTPFWIDDPDQPEQSASREAPDLPPSSF